MARILRVTPQRVSQLVTAGVIDKVGCGRFSLLAAVTSYIEFVRGRPADGDGSTGALDYATQRARLLRFQADLAEHQLLRERGSTIAIEAAVAPFAEKCGVIRQRLLVAPAKVAPLVAGQEVAAALAVQAEVAAILTELSQRRRRH